MDIKALIASLPGGAESLRLALASPAVREAAKKAGIDLDDEAQLEALLREAQALKAAAAQNATPASPGTALVPVSEAVPVPTNSYVRHALRTYQAIAAMA